MVEGGGEGPTPSRGAPSLGVLVTVFHRSRFYRDALASIAEQVGPLPRVEVVVVHSPDVTIDVPARFNTQGWTCRAVRSEAVGEGPFLADGLDALATDFVVPLDDDDLWTPWRLATVGQALAAVPSVAYYHNGQEFVDADGGPVTAASARRHLRRFSGSPRGTPVVVGPASLRRSPGRLARWGSSFNNSSVAIRRSVLDDCVEDLRATKRLIDSFMFYAGAASGGALVFDPRRLTRYRIHTWNRSRGARTLGPFERAEPSQTREGRLASLEAMGRMVHRRGADWLVPWVDHDRTYFDLLEGLREGESDRVRTLRRSFRLARYVRYGDPVMNLVLVFTGAAQAVAPGVAFRAYWSEDPTPPAALAADGPR
ncbi:MAG TPA: glycosyltransferase [Thermoplasmata archaeon]|nr:glycosyltransferase [Thermoplasmata archaeon]